MSLQTGAELITLALLINKATGVYGLLALLTGFALDAVQLSMYLYSVAVLVTLAVLLPHVRRRSPFPNLVLSWVYVIDTALNAAYTAYFAAAWFAASEDGHPADGAGEQAPDTAASMVLIVVVTLARLYLMLVVMGWTRSVLRGHAATLAGDKALSAQPFAAGSPEGEGWRGRAGRAMIRVGQDYWLGGMYDIDEERDAEEAARRPLAASMEEEEDDG